MTTITRTHSYYDSASRRAPFTALLTNPDGRPCATLITQWIGAQPDDPDDTQDAAAVIAFDGRGVFMVTCTMQYDDDGALTKQYAYVPLAEAATLVTRYLNRAVDANIPRPE